MKICKSRKSHCLLLSLFGYHLYEEITHEWLPNIDIVSNFEKLLTDEVDLIVISQ
ncbi:hypothetical protein Q7526_03485 [Glaesserella parasuis]|nr:hypothetical protein [Glaesserella parasuis]MDP0341255.1 hypothetical protein [Glaesserella parasuis]MDP0356901.1 hypothetical protein [Glaesserella parasuis]